MVESKVKGMILNDIATQVQTKIFIFKEVGPLNLHETKKFYEGQSDEK